MKVLSLVGSVMFLMSLTSWGATDMQKLASSDPHAKFLILHGDDAGMNHAINMASLARLKEGHISSLSVMTPCPWVYEMAEILKACPRCDVGVHVTLNSEWRSYRWQPVSAYREVPSLVDADGMLLASPLASLQQASLDDVRKEISAQISKAQRLGLNLTHVDMHMGTVALRAAWLEAYVKAAKEAGLLPMLVKWSDDLEHYFKCRRVEYSEIKAFLLQAEKSGEFMLDRLITDVGGRSSLAERKKAYWDAIKSLKAGVSQLITHVAEDQEEMAAMAGEGALREQRRVWDNRILASSDFHQLLKSEGVSLISWAEVKDLYKSKE